MKETNELSYGYKILLPTHQNAYNEKDWQHEVYWQHEDIHQLGTLVHCWCGVYIWKTVG